MINTFDRTTLRLINADIEQALKTVAEKYGVHMSLGGTSFTPDNYTTKLNVSIKRDGEVVTPEAKTFEKYAAYYKIDKKLGDTFTHRGNKFTITGLKTSSPKYPVLAKDAKGRTFKFTTDTVING
jgi:hypothetical protein